MLYIGDYPWQPLTDTKEGMKCISVGTAGVWAVRAKDDTIWIRMNEENSKPIGKVAPDGGMGQGWTRLTVLETCTIK